MIDFKISLPLGILKPIGEKLSKWIYEETYRQSHEYYLSRTVLGSFWTDIGEHMKVDLKFATLYSNSRMPLSRIAILNQAEQTLENMQVEVIAESSFARYRDAIEIDSIGKKAHIAVLPNLPFKNIEMHDDKFFLPFDKVEVRAHYTIGDKAFSISHVTSPMYNEDLNSDWAKKWGHIWNLDLIRLAQRTFREKLQYHLILKYKYASLKRVLS